MNISNQINSFLDKHIIFTVVFCMLGLGYLFWNERNASGLTLRNLWKDRDLVIKLLLIFGPASAILGLINDLLANIPDVIYWPIITTLLVWGFFKLMQSEVEKQEQSH